MTHVCSSSDNVGREKKSEFFLRSLREFLLSTVEIYCGFFLQFNLKFKCAIFCSYHSEKPLKKFLRNTKKILNLKNCYFHILIELTLYDDGKIAFAYFFLVSI